MKQAQSAPRETYNAILSKEKTKKTLEKFGPESEQRLKAVLAKFKLPEEKTEREKYLEGVAGLAQNTIGRKMNGYSALGNYDLQDSLLFKMFEGRLAMFEKALGICSQSSQIGEYAMFLGRESFMPEAILRSMKLFSNGREIEFQEITQKKKNVRKEILEAAESQNGKSLSRLIGLLEKNLASLNELPGTTYEIAALLCGDVLNARALLKKMDPDTYNVLKEMSEEGQGGVLFSSQVKASARAFHLRSLMRFGIYTDPENGECIPYDQYFKIDGVHGYVAKDKKDLYKRRLGGYAVGMEMMLATKEHAQHELQHIFDNATLTKKESGSEADGEYRAYLAELAFYPDKRIERCAQLMNGDMKKMLLVAVSSETTEIEPHDEAKARIGLRMRRINPQSDAQVEKESKKLINNEYKKKTGLSYDEIIEPFGKKDDSG
jgi:hypothetical protein